MALRALMQKYGPAAAISYSSVTLTLFSTIYSTLTFGYDHALYIRDREPRGDGGPRPEALDDGYRRPRRRGRADGQAAPRLDLCDDDARHGSSCP